MVLWPRWEVVPFFTLWIALTVLYGFAAWSGRVTVFVLVALAATTLSVILVNGAVTDHVWDEPLEVPLMGTLFVAMVWHARRRQAAVRAAEALVAQQEQFLHDVSHELRTPLTIARGHLDLLRSVGDGPELGVAVDELGRMERIISRLLRLARAQQPQLLAFEGLDAEAFLEDVFLRWSELAPRAWRLGSLVPGHVRADAEILREALDALLENAVKYTRPGDTIRLRSYVRDFGLVIEISDSGVGIEAAALDRIFDRFARGDGARTRTTGGVGLGLAIVDAVARAHGGTCTASSTSDGATFALRLPRFQPSEQQDAAPTLEFSRA